MAFDDSKFHAPAERADVALVAIKMSISLDHIISSLQKLEISTPLGLHPQIEALKVISKELADNFDTLTGYTPDEA